MRKKRSVATFLAIAVVTCGAVTLAVSEGDGTAAIRARQAAMEDVGDAIKVLAAIAKKQEPFDAAVVKKNAEVIAENLHEAAQLFPPGSDKGEDETWAKAEIWSDPEGFKTALEAAHKAAVDMQGVTEEAAFGPALAALGNGCKNCHDTFRRPKR
jgi:cytochrome c556